MYGRPSDITERCSEVLIRIGSIGASELADDDDVVLIIAPQNGMQYAIQYYIFSSTLPSTHTYMLCLYPQ